MLPVHCTICCVRSEVLLLADVCDSHAGNKETNEPTTNNTHTHTHTWREEIKRTAEAKH